MVMRRENGYRCAMCGRLLLFGILALLSPGLSACAGAPPPPPRSDPAPPAEARCPDGVKKAILLANDGDNIVRADVDAGIALYLKALELDPTRHRIVYKLAKAYKKKEAWDKVAETMARAVQLAPSHADDWLELGYALRVQASKGTLPFEQAKGPLLRCVEIDPNLADCHEQLGTVYLWMDEEQKALESYTRAIEVDPTEVSYYAPLADLYIRLDRFADAEAVLLQAKKVAKPGDKALYAISVLLAQVYQSRGDLKGMVSELEAARAYADPEKPEGTQILFNLGSTYAQLDPPRKAEAVQMLKAFHTRACKGSKAAIYRTECETAAALVSKLGGGLQ